MGQPGVAILALALAVRLLALAVHPPAWDGDQELYATLAASAAAGDGWWARGRAEVGVHPLLPSLHAALLSLLPGLDTRRAGMGLALLVSSLLPLVAGRAVAALVSPRAGVIAALLLALQPHHVLRAAALEPDLLGALLLAWAALALHRQDWGLAGAILGIGYLDRPEVAFVAVAVATWLVLSRRAGAVGLLRYLLCFAALAAVFVLYVHAQTGRWTLSGKDRWTYQQGVHQWRARGAPLERAAIPALRADVPSLGAHLREHPSEFAAGFLYRTGRLLRNVAVQLGWILLVPALAGAVRLWRRSRDVLFLLGLPLLALPVLALVATFFRHAIPPAVALLMLAAVGLDAWLVKDALGNRTR